MCTEIIANTLTVAHSAARATDVEWDRFLVSLHDLRTQGLVIVVHPDHPGPTATQRSRFVDAWKERGTQPHVSVVTDGRLHRGVITAFSWLIGDNIRPFALSEFRAALDYCGAAEEARVAVVEELRTAAARFGFGQVLTPSLRAVALRDGAVEGSKSDGTRNTPP